MSDKASPRSWHEKKRWIFIWLVFFPPLGMALTWMKRWSFTGKAIATLLSLVWFLSWFGEAPQSTTSKSTETESPQVVQVDPEGGPAPSSEPEPKTEPGPEPKPQVLFEAVDFASEASTLVQTAQTTEDWNTVISTWQQSIDSMKLVPESSEYFQQAQGKVEEYSGYLAYAEKQIQKIEEAEAEAERQRQLEIQRQKELEAERQRKLAAERQRQQQQRQQQQAAPRAGSPLRSPVSGSCDCPYDRDSAGRSCGKRSAYSRPGGRSPACYVGE